MENIINGYNQKLETLKTQCMTINSDDDFKKLFNSVMSLFAKDVIKHYNKLSSKIDQLKNEQTLDKISKLNMVIDCLDGDGTIYGIDCTDIILRGYIAYFYLKFRNIMFEWNIKDIKNIKESAIKGEILNSAKNELSNENMGEYINIIPEIVLMINNMRDSDILKQLFLLNNLNIIIDVYLYKKQKNIKI